MPSADLRATYARVLGSLLIRTIAMVQSALLAWRSPPRLKRCRTVLPDDAGTIHDLALMLDRLCNEREVLPSAGVVDSQSVKAPGARTRGYDANKKLSGRKRHIAVDTDGRLLAMNLTPTDIADSTGAQMVLDGLIKRWPWVKHLFGDAAYDRRQLMNKAAFLDFTVEVVRRLQGQQGFAVQPRRWVVERTFAWLMRYRRLVRDYEQRIDVSENMTYLAMGSLLLHRLNFR